MMRTRVFTTADADCWRSVLPARRHVLGSVEYAAITERQTGWSARLFVAEDETGQPAVAYPFFLRPARELPFAAHLTEDFWDTISPEYTGPVALGPGADGLDFPVLFARYCREQRIIAEFSRLHPWRNPAGLVDPDGIELNCTIVYLDLTWDEEQIWNRSLTSDARRQTRQAQQAGILVRRAESADDVRAFHRLHTSTMDRRHALDRYYCSPDDFLSVYELMPDNAFFTLAEYQGKLVAGGLYFQDETDVYWHLSAMDREFAGVRPVNAYLHQTICWMLRQGKQRMVMGGGYQAGDGVFRFKANFSPLRADFCTYRRVHDAEMCAALTRAWAAHHGGQPPPTGYFPAFRSAAPQAAAEL